MMIQKSPYSFLRSLVKGQDHSFFKLLTGVFCTVDGTLFFFFLADFCVFILINVSWKTSVHVLYPPGTCLKCKLWSVKAHSMSVFKVGECVDQQSTDSDSLGWVFDWRFREGEKNGGGFESNSGQVLIIVFSFFLNQHCFVLHHLFYASFICLLICFV